MGLPSLLPLFLSLLLPFALPILSLFLHHGNKGQPAFLNLSPPFLFFLTLFLFLLDVSFHFLSLCTGGIIHAHTGRGKAEHFLDQYSIPEAVIPEMHQAFPDVHPFIVHKGLLEILCQRRFKDHQHTKSPLTQ